MKIFIQSVHASLEFDQATMFLGMGHQVAGSFDVGSVQKPKIKGCTDVSHRIEDAYVGADMFLLHQTEDYSNVFLRHAQEMGDRPVVLTYFGQGCDAQHQQTAALLCARKNTYVVAYSKKEYNMLIGLGAPLRKVRMIRFGKVISDFEEGGGWTGRLPICFMSCNSLKHRGDGTSWPVMDRLMRGDIPLLLGGKDSLQHPCGIGEISWDALKSVYRQARCYLTLGTKPAPYVLTLVEAMCSGTPVVAYDNGCGITGEDLGVLIAHSVDEIVLLVKSICSDRELAQQYSRKMKECAYLNFDMNRISLQWNEFMEEMWK